MLVRKRTEQSLAQGGDGDKKERRQQIAEAALNLFARSDYASVSIKQIGRELGINPSLIYYYFQDKEDLFCASVEEAILRALENYKKIRMDHTSPEEIINDWIGNNFELLGTISDLLKVMIEYARSRNSASPVDELIRRFYREECRILAGAFEDGIALGRFRKVDSEKLALFVSAHLDGIVIAGIVRADFDLAQAFDDLRAYLWEHLSIDGQ
jgi:AcrR family transcriptional regulator